MLKTPEPMYYTKIIFPADQLENVLTTLHSLGVLHVSKARELKPIEVEYIQQRLGTVARSRELLTKILKYIQEPVLVKIKETISVEELEDEAHRIRSKLEEIMEQINGLSLKINRIEETLNKKKNLYKYINAMIKILGDVPISIIYWEGHFHIKPIIGSKGISKTLESRLPIGAKIIDVIPCNSEEIYIILYPREQVEIIKELITELKLNVLDLSPYKDLKLSNLSLMLKEEIEKLHTEYINSLNEIKNIVKNNLEFIAYSKIILDNLYEKLNALYMAAKSKYAYMITGWTPESSKQELLYTFETKIPRTIVILEEPEIKEHSSGEEEEETPPTKLNNKGISKAFEVLTKLYGIPRYKEWDPTPLIAYVFPIFFGLMLGDAIYGVALLLITMFVLDKFVENPESEGYVLFKNILKASAIATIIIGVLSGTYLGDLVKRITGFDVAIIHELSDPLMFIGISLIIGLIHVNLAHILALIRAIKARNTWRIVLKAGLFIAEVFGIPYVVYKFLSLRILPIPLEMYNLLMYGAIGGVALIIVASIKLSGAFGGIVWLFELTGLLGDVMSYARIAGVGMATAYLAQSFNLMSGLASSTIASSLSYPIGLVVGALISIPIMFLGHLLNLVLSSLGAFIHSLRLFFVEFLPKFYEGGGVEYKPLKLVIQKTIILSPSL